ncbi:glycine--tRNA ligase subunit beta [Catellatospora methionotrophica]|uniref:glycine--tRNA ligase subunit beta n=1 Tax=Catellatospora methionotrophica TaxID=121620 RepID=UPI0033FE425C
MQEALAQLSAYWSAKGCLVVPPMNTEIGAATLHPATALRVLGPAPWRVAYAESVVRPGDARYGRSPDVFHCFTQFQVVLKPEPGNAPEMVLESLAAIGVDVRKNDIRFVDKDHWASPTLGAKALGWEIWLNGIEVAGLLYLQQVADMPLDPVAAEISYGIERIVMALQKVDHVKDIVYGQGLTYGDVFGNTEYEMSNYYLDDAEVGTYRTLLEEYALETARMIDKGLAVPAHRCFVKMSHAYDILEARGALSTADRNRQFGRMRRYFKQIAKLWLDRAEGSVATAGRPVRLSAHAGGEEISPDGPATLVFEIGVEDLPADEVRQALAQTRLALQEQLAAGRLDHGKLEVWATARRIVAVLADVAGKERDGIRITRGPHVKNAYDSDGAATSAAIGFARSQGVGLADLDRVGEANARYVCVRRAEPGRPAVEALGPMLAHVVRSLSSATKMRWHDSTLSYRRPIRRLVALLGTRVIPVEVSNLSAGRVTQTHHAIPRPVNITTADEYLSAMEDAGIIVDEKRRRGAIVSAAATAAAGVDGLVADDPETEAVIDRLNFLVEKPFAVLGCFGEDALGLPEAAVLRILRDHQIHLPVRNARGALTPYFVAIANGYVDEGLVRRGYEEALRANLDHVMFCYEADLKTPILDLRQRLKDVAYVEGLGSLDDRATRIAEISGDLAATMSGVDVAALREAGRWIKIDSGSRMVGEMHNLAGLMGREYLLRQGASADTAQAVFEVELPRHDGDYLPETPAGTLLALADRLELMVGLACIGDLPKGASDPLGVRRAAAGVVAICRKSSALDGLSLADAVAITAERMPMTVSIETREAVLKLLARRWERQLVSEGHPVEHVRAVRLHAVRPRQADRLLVQLSYVADRDDFRRLLKSLQRARGLVPREYTQDGDYACLVEPADLALLQTVLEIAAMLHPMTDVDAFLATACRLPEAVDRFLDVSLIMVADPDLRAARIRLMAAVAALGDGVLDWTALH